MTYLTRVVQDLDGAGYEPVILPRLVRAARELEKEHDRLGLPGKIGEEATAYGVVSNALALSMLSRLKGSRGDRMMGYVVLTSFSQALYVCMQLLAPEAWHTLVLSSPELVLYLVRLVELDQEWRGFWLRDLLATVPREGGSTADQIVSSYAQGSPELRGLRKRTWFHRTLPRLGWLVDLRLVAHGLHGRKDVYSRTELGDGFLSGLREMNTAGLLFDPYPLVRQCYGFETKRPLKEFLLEREIRKFYGQTRHVLGGTTRFLRISTLKYLLCTYYCINGKDLGYEQFSEGLINMYENGKVELSSGPNPQYNDDLVSDGTTFQLVALK
jgi:hypothetical protein